MRDSRVEKIFKSMLYTISTLRNEETAVSEFLKNSQNYKALKQIVQTSKASKTSSLGSYPLFQTCYQLETGDENVINNLEKAKTFNELFKILSLPRSTLDTPNRGSLLIFLYMTAFVSQNYNSAYYSTWLALDIRLYASENLYYIDFNGLEEAASQAEQSNNTKRI